MTCCHKNFTTKKRKTKLATKKKGKRKKIDPIYGQSIHQMFANWVQIEITKNFFYKSYKLITIIFLNYNNFPLSM
jgi:hypothetical protein